MSVQPSVPRSLVIAKYSALVAAMLGLMVNEYLFAIKTGTPPQIAWTYPAALDIYAYAAFYGGRPRDVAVALIMMSASQAGAHLPMPHGNPILAIAPWAIAMPIVLWRVHHLASNHTAHVAVDVVDDAVAPSAGGPEEEDDAVITPLPQQKRWSHPEAAAAIRYYQSKGLTTRKAIAPRMGISPQMVGQHMAKMERELVAA